MKLYSWNKELLYATAQFMDVFNNIKIERNDGKIIRVKCLNGRRSRIFKSLENPERSPIQPPLIIISRSGLERDPTRVADLNSHLNKTSDGVINYNYYAPNPINITFELTVVTKYQGDMDRILSNFIPFSNQSFFVKTPNPKDSTRDINHEVVWNGSIMEDDNTEIDFDTSDLHVAIAEFTFKTWIWAGTDQDDMSDETSGNMSDDNNIKSINLQPGLCSLGTQQLLWKNNVVDSDALCALSGFKLDDTTYYGDIYSLCHWYAVPRKTSFDDYEDMIISGKIEPMFYDSMILSGTSGYVRDLGLDLGVGDLFTLSGNEVYFVDNEGGILIYADSSSLNKPFSAVCMPTITDA